jgi:hypothetical protein
MVRGIRLFLKAVRKVFRSDPVATRYERCAGRRPVERLHASWSIKMASTDGYRGKK